MELGCRLCPHECGVLRSKGERGFCGADAEMHVSRAALHFWEEPPVSGESGSGAIFFSNCTLKCCYCQNAAISRGGAGKASSVADVAGMCLDLARQGAMNINLVTPTHYADGVCEAVSMARSKGMDLPVVWNTSGYESVKAVEDNVGVVDVYLTDFKYCDDALSLAYSKVPDYKEVATSALDAMVEHVGAPAYDSFGGCERMVSGVIVRHLMLPGAMDDSKAVLRHLKQRYGGSIRVSIMNQYTPVLSTAADAGDDFAEQTLRRHPQLARTVSSDEYEELLDYADSIGLDDYFWQDGETCKESFIPDFC